MNTQSVRFPGLILAALVLFAPSCSSNASTRDLGPIDAARLDKGSGALRDSALRDSASVDASKTLDIKSTLPDAKPLVVIDYGLVKSCTEVGAKTCFSNLECAADRRCQNLSTEEDPVPCCMPGPRGTKQPGETCTGQIDCASGVCIQKWYTSDPALCSKTCTGDEDCPTKMKKCVPIAGSGSTDKWCFPE
jgi:hypothetical protein